MQVLINDLLTFSRVGRVHDSDEVVALDGALDEALEPSRSRSPSQELGSCDPSPFPRSGPIGP